MYEFDLALNPVPWAIGPVGSGRRNGKPYSYVGRNQELHAFQEAVTDLVGVHEFLEGDICLELYFWRELPEYKNEKDHAIRKHHADNTNMQKATEDALQGCIYVNDKFVVKNITQTMAQGPDVEGRVYVRAYLI